MGAAGPWRKKAGSAPGSGAANTSADAPCQRGPAPTARPAPFLAAMASRGRRCPAPRPMRPSAVHQPPRPRPHPAVAISARRRRVTGDLPHGLSRSQAGQRSHPHRRAASDRTSRHGTFPDSGVRVCPRIAPGAGCSARSMMPCSASASLAASRRVASRLTSKPPPVGDGASLNAPPLGAPGRRIESDTPRPGEPGARRKELLTPRSPQAPASCAAKPWARCSARQLLQLGSPAVDRLSLPGIARPIFRAIKFRAMAIRHGAFRKAAWRGNAGLMHVAPLRRWHDRSRLRTPAPHPKGVFWQEIKPEITKLGPSRVKAPPQAAPAFGPARGTRLASGASKLQLATVIFPFVTT